LAVLFCSMWVPVCLRVKNNRTEHECRSDAITEEVGWLQELADNGGKNHTKSCEVFKWLCLFLSAHSLGWPINVLFMLYDVLCLFAFWVRVGDLGFSVLTASGPARWEQPKFSSGSGVSFLHWCWAAAQRSVQRTVNAPANLLFSLFDLFTDAALHYFFSIPGFFQFASFGENFTNHSLSRPI